MVIQEICLAFLRNLLCSLTLVILRDVSVFFIGFVVSLCSPLFPPAGSPRSYSAPPTHSSAGASVAFCLDLSPSRLSGVPDASAQCIRGSSTLPVPHVGYKMLPVLDSTPCDSMWNPTQWLPFPPGMRSGMRSGVQDSYTAGNLLPSQFLSQQVGTSFPLRYNPRMWCAFSPVWRVPILWISPFDFPIRVEPGRVGWHLSQDFHRSFEMQNLELGAYQMNRVKWARASKSGNLLGCIN